MSDAFDDDADPYAPPRLTRRVALTLLGAAPTALAGCAARRIACVSPGEVTEGPCRHRFCRHHTAM